MPTREPSPRLAQTPVERLGPGLAGRAIHERGIREGMEDGSSWRGCRQP